MGAELVTLPLERVLASATTPDLVNIAYLFRDIAHTLREDKAEAMENWRQLLTDFKTAGNLIIGLARYAEDYILPLQLDDSFQALHQHFRDNISGEPQFKAEQLNEVTSLLYLLLRYVQGSDKGYGGYETGNFQMKTASLGKTVVTAV